MHLKPPSWGRETIGVWNECWDTEGVLAPTLHHLTRLWRMRDVERWALVRRVPGVWGFSSTFCPEGHQVQ